MKVPYWIHHVKRIKTIDSTAADRANTLIKQALGDLIANGSISLISVKTSNPIPGQLAIDVVYVNNSLGTEVQRQYIL